MSAPLPQWLIDAVNQLAPDQRGTALGFAAAGWAAGRDSTRPLPTDPELPQPAAAGFGAGSSLYAERADGPTYLAEHDATLRSRTP